LVAGSSKYEVRAAGSADLGLSRRDLTALALGDDTAVPGTHTVLDATLLSNGSGVL
jgi:hypothetical protein